MAVRIQFRRGTAAEWASANPTLAPGELGYEVDTAKFKLGDGSTVWNSLDYAGINEQDIEDAIANVINLAPEDLDTLSELAAAIGDDRDFINTISNSIVDAESNALAYTNSVANAVTTAVNSYTNNAIANLVDSSPSTLDTLNELAAALGDDPNFAATITTNLGGKINFIADSVANFDNNNPDPILANTLYITTDTRRIKVGDGIGDWANAVYVGEDFVLHHDFQTEVHGISNTMNLVYQVDLSNTQSTLQNNINDVSSALQTANTALSSSITALDGRVETLETTSNTLNDSVVSLESRTDDLETNSNTLTTAVGSLGDRANTLETASTSLETRATNLETASTSLETRADTLEETSNTLTSDVNSLTTRTNTLEVTANALEASLSTLETRANGVDSTILTLAPLNEASLVDTTLSGTTILGINSTIGGVTPTELGYLTGTTSGIQTQILNKADIESPTFGGSVVLPVTTTIGNVVATEIAQLEGVSSNIQTQLDAKLATASAASIYAPLADATLTGTVSLPATTSIGDVSATELGHVNGVTSGIQSQLDAKAPTADPTFTGTVSGVTAAMVGLGNVDNTADADKPISTATQAALNAKAALAGATFTGDVEVPDMVVTGNLIVQGSTTTISASDLSVKDNMIYLNQAGVSVLTDAVGDGTNVIYTTAEAHGYDVGDDVTVANTTPSSFDIASPGESIIAVTSNTFTVASTVTDTYVSGGTARGKVHSNPDLGWAAGRYDTVNGSGYAHAGVFRDASDGVFKFFDGYVPEPDESVFIDTTDNTFALADVAVADLTATNVNANAVVFADGTTQDSAGVPSLTGFTEKTASYQLDTLAYKDNVVEMNSASAVTFTIPLEATFSWPVGASMDIIQTGTGQVTIAIESGGTLNFTPGNKLRTQWSSCTIMKRGADSWILYGDLTA